MALWYEYFDEESENYYYFNSMDDTTQWERPVNRYGEAVDFVPFESVNTVDPLQETHKGEDWLDLLERNAGPTDIERSNLPQPQRDLKHSSSLPEDFSNKKVRDRDFRGDCSKDYIGLAKIYHLEKEYRQKKRNIKCILCFQNMCSEVFFPCEHMCVCKACIQKENICEEFSLQHDDGFPYCPLCNSVIKKIIRYEKGKEVEKYWDWVYEMSPQLPKGFMRDFRHSAAIIQKIYIDERDADYLLPGDEKHLRSPERSTSCNIS